MTRPAHAMRESLTNPALFRQLPLGEQVYLVARMLRRSGEFLPVAAHAVCTSLAAACDRLNRLNRADNRCSFPDPQGETRPPRTGFRWAV